MNVRIYDLRIAIYVLVAAGLSFPFAYAQGLTSTTNSGDLEALHGGDQVTNTVYPIDLPSALRLAGARNLDVQIARERFLEAEANRQSAVEQFLPWIAPGIGFHRRDGVAQAVPSEIGRAHV